MRTARLLLILLVPALMGCSPDREPTTTPRRDLLFGYYGDCSTCVSEVKDHASMIWLAGWEGADGHIPTIIARAKEASPHKLVIMLPGFYKNGRVYEPAFAAARAIFDGMRANQTLSNVAAVYPQDEPELLGLHDDEITKANARLRDLMSEYQQLANKPLAVIYNGRQEYPGLASYDWVGIDSYDAGEKVLGQRYTELTKLLRADQRLLLVPGGASPWKQSPKPFFSYADANPQVVGIVAFLWADNANAKLGSGIRSNGMAAEYRAYATREP